MTYKSSYVKDIEEYFLSLAGKGIMLSSKDYDLILSWKKKKIPKEVVFKGISKAFDQSFNKKSNDRFLPSLCQVVSFVEEVIGSYQATIGMESSGELDSCKVLIQKIVERLNEIIKSEKRGNVRGNYIHARKRILALINRDDEDTFKTIEQIEKDFFENSFQSLSQTERDKIMPEAENRVNRSSRFMTERARRESVMSFRNQILRKKYGLKNIVSGD
jgi:hypothetical protein